ncbi:Crp/Fnr family transcriptional regulator [Limnohabitans sp. JirII-29]|jgi:CRP-like cAMP-binding protein|uniref:Crp/Fnr family transcriptional regulator n=1 Tax=Limnohabitans sp. JirII-29 TaxID=1835756 RepID=UPI0011B2377E|nr:Crp/Fnr family transcriptional regulator [Limnohabitans sp. JirII-29]
MKIAFAIQNTKACLNISQNSLLEKLALSDQAMMAKLCEFTTLKVGDVIGSPTSEKSYVYFLLSACVAMVVRPTGGTMGLAVGLVGSEGAVGLQHAFGLGAGNVTLIVQASGLALRIDGLTIQRVLKKKPEILMLFSRYLWSVYQEVAFLAALMQMQDIKSRLAGWLLLSSIRSDSLQLKLTQTYLADMLGVRRSSVTLAALELKQQGIISYSRGYLNILNDKALKAEAHWVL